MRPTPQLATRARVAFSGAMTDTCRILTYVSDAIDEVGQPMPTYATGAEIACAFRPGASAESEAATATKHAATAELWLPLDTAVTRHDRVLITRLWGETLSSALAYSVVGDPRREVGRLICQLREVSL